MKKIYLTLLLFIAFMPLWASHIVGGEIALKYIRMKSTGVYEYELTLNLYSDHHSSTFDNTLFLGIYRKSDNGLVIPQISLPFVENIHIEHPDSPCSDDIETEIFRYSKLIELNGADFSDVGGYYIIWDRCCRNDDAINVQTPGDVGNTFYLEFPAIENGGTQFINSSPVFDSPDGDYVCLNTDFSFNFQATDADGDELRYYMVTPFKGKGSPSSPAPSVPATYSFPIPEISWQGGYSANDAIHSNVGKPLSINEFTGELTVNTHQLGLYIFSIKCEEYRAGVKIGEVRRDFQLLVILCDENIPPVIAIDVPNADNPDITNPYIEGDTIVLDATNGVCFNVNFEDIPFEKLRNIKVLPVGNSFKLSKKPIASTVTLDENGKGALEFCWEECLDSDNGEVYVFDLITDDNTCPVKRGKVRVKLKVISRTKNQSTSLITDHTSNFDPTTNTANVTIGEELRIKFNASFTDNRQLKVYAQGEGFELSDAFMSFPQKTGSGDVSSELVWNPTCELIKEAGLKPEYVINFITEEQNNCGITYNTTQVVIRLQEPPSTIDTFQPYNVFTPNATDGVNNTYKLPDLPENTCFSVYRSIKIYNRWGKLVFESDAKDFEWKAENYPTGVYFYVIDYQSRKLSGSISLIK